MCLTELVPCSLQLHLRNTVTKTEIMQPCTVNMFNPTSPTFSIHNYQEFLFLSWKTAPVFQLSCLQSGAAPSLEVRHAEQSEGKGRKHSRHFSEELQHHASKKLLINGYLHVGCVRACVCARVCACVFVYGVCR